MKFFLILFAVIGMNTANAQYHPAHYYDKSDERSTHAYDSLRTQASNNDQARTDCTQKNAWMKDYPPAKDRPSRISRSRYDRSWNPNRDNNRDKNGRFLTGFFTGVVVSEFSQIFRSSRCSSGFNRIYYPSAKDRW